MTVSRDLFADSTGVRAADSGRGIVAAKLHLLDAIGVGLAARDAIGEPIGSPQRRLCGDGSASVFGLERRGSAAAPH